MSKSIGNVLLVHDMVKSIPGEVLRLSLLSAHYRQPLDWSDELVDSSRKTLDRFYGALRGIELDAAERAAAEPTADVVDALEDDLNTPKALSAMFALAKKLNKATDDAQRKQLAASLLASGQLLGIAGGDADAWFSDAGDDAISADEIEQLIADRKAARAAKNFGLADELRDKLTSNGISIEDGPSGTRWRRTG